MNRSSFAAILGRLDEMEFQMKVQKFVKAVKYREKDLGIENEDSE
jgi:hypothetical protein